tara:strand:- start:2692 stop:3147 length:456 start_codon:yes stop_codon:yes gene_type:complete
MNIEKLLYEILIKRLPEDLCLLIINYYKKNIIFSNRNWYKLNQLYKSGRNTIHLSDMPDICTIELLEKYIIKMHGSISYRCCNENGIVFKNYNTKRIKKSILNDNYSQHYLISNKNNLNSFPKIERRLSEKDKSKKLQNYINLFLPKIYKI